MSGIIDTLQSKGVAGLLSRAPAAVGGAIRHASASTGVDFSYLVQQAQAESNFDPAAKARSSSASGLYQFIESTWMNMVERYGEKHGVQTDGKSKAEILALREDPKTASLMAAEFASENERFLQTHWGGDIGSTELYFAHFLGAGQAASFLNAKDENPAQQAAVLFPKAAKANRNVFYEPSTGRARSLDEVYAFFDRKFDAPGESSEPIKPGAKASLFAKAETQGGHYMTRSSYSPPSYQQLLTSPLEIMLLSQLELPIGRSRF